MKVYATLSLALLLGAAGTAAFAQDAAPAQGSPPAQDATAAQGSANGVGNNTTSPADRVQATSPQASDQAQSQVPDSTAKAVDALGSAPGQATTDTSATAATGAGSTDADASATTDTKADGKKKHKDKHHKQ
jgi:hypothetical protein